MGIRMPALAFNSASLEAALGTESCMVFYIRRTGPSGGHTSNSIPSLVSWMLQTSDFVILLCSVNAA